MSEIEHQGTIAMTGTTLSEDQRQTPTVEEYLMDGLTGGLLYGPGTGKPLGILPVTPAPQDLSRGPTDSQMLDALASNYWNLRCVDVPTGGDDSDVDWVVTENQTGKPSEVEVARAYADDPRMAVRRALRSTDKSAARCASCDEVLYDGDSVYYEHGEGGHIHSWCASDDPQSFVDEDEAPLKAGEEIPKPFAYSVENYEGQP